MNTTNNNSQMLGNPLWIKTLIILLFAIVWVQSAQSQVKIGTNPKQIEKSSLLELESQTEGLLLPRLLDTLAINALDPPSGMLIYLAKTPQIGLYIRKNGSWDFLSGASSSSLDLKADLASPTFTGTVTLPTPFTLGATSVTATAAELNHVVGVTSAIQTQLDAKQSTLTNSAGLSAALSDETGTGLAVFATSPTLVSPVIGAATGTSLSVSGQLSSTMATGTAPLTVVSTTPVANLSIGGNAATATRATTATNLAAGLGGQIPYQSAAGTTAMLANGTTGQVLQSNGATLPPTWATPNVATSSNFVDLTTAQTIAGSKTFSGNTAFSGNTLVSGDVLVASNLSVAGTTTLVDGTVVDLNVINSLKAGDVTYINTKGTANQVLTTDSAGITSWATPNIGSAGIWPITAINFGSDFSGGAFISASGFYSVIGNIVSFSGSLEFSGDGYSGGGSVNNLYIEIALPVASTFTNLSDASGSVSGTMRYGDAVSGYLKASASSNKLRVYLVGGGMYGSSIRDPKIALSGMYIVK